MSKGVKIAVALSGGVDSATAAALLKEQGGDVFALTMLLREGDDAMDARRVAEALSIPHHIVDFRTQFDACVVQPFAEIYLRGETPNPCALCNRFIKFGALMEAAKSLGAEALATGHYVRRVETSNGAQLHRGVDEGRDQSYFLFNLTQEQIDFLRLPLGEMTKVQTRELAARYALPVAHKPDSQDICFVPDGDYVSVLEKLRPGAIAPGEIVDETGHVLGKHQGIIHFTVGQRRGLNVSDRTGDHNEPLFVVRLDAASRRVVVGPREALLQREVFLREMNWLAPDLTSQAQSEEGLEVWARLRSTQKPARARLFLEETARARFVLETPVSGVAPGQAGVAYAGSRLLGGGWIG